MTAEISTTSTLVAGAHSAPSFTFDVAAAGDFAVDGDSYTAILMHDGLGTPTTVQLPLVEGVPATHLFVHHASRGYPAAAQWDIASFATNGVATYRRPTPPFRMAGTPRA